MPKNMKSKKNLSKSEKTPKDQFIQIRTTKQFKARFKKYLDEKGISNQSGFIINLLNHYIENTTNDEGIKKFYKAMKKEFKKS